LSPDDGEQLIRTRAIPPRFALYPAYGWPHKNHVRLIEALSILKGRGVTVPLVCSGHTTEHTDAALARARELGVRDVLFLDRVSGPELLCLYDRADCLVFPSLFEGFGLPVLEGFAAGLPVACSNTTSLPELAGDAAVQFDPLDPAAIADAIERVWLDDALRAALIDRGRVRASRYTWDRVAAETVDVYRAASGVGSHG
jgi:alpha-1,3-rhamnosyl/mannosyltransferase